MTTPTLSSAFSQAIQIRDRRRFTLENHFLWKTLRGLAVGQALIALRAAVNSSAWTDIIDNSTGTAETGMTFLSVPTGPYDATQNGSAASAAVATGQSSSGSYVPTDTVTLTGGTGTEPVLLVTDTEVQSATQNAGGSGTGSGSGTFVGTTGTGTKFSGTCTVTSGVMSVPVITVHGDYTVNPTSLSAEPVTVSGAGITCTGATLTLKMGVLKANVQSGGNMSVYPSNPVSQGSTSGSGTGATFNVIWNAGVSGSNFDTAVGNVVSAEAAFADALNAAFAIVGLPAIVFTGTSVSSDGTVPAMTLTETPLAPASASTAVDFEDGVANMVLARNNMATCVRAVNMLLTSVGYNTFADLTGGSAWNSYVKPTPPYGGPAVFSTTPNAQPDPTAALVINQYPSASTATGTGAVAGQTSISVAALDTFLGAAANDVATLISIVNQLLPIGATAALPVVAVDNDLVVTPPFNGYNA